MLPLTRPVVDIAITCSDFGASLRFYRDLLGFEVVEEVTIPAEVAQAAGLAPSGFRQVRLRVGEALLKLMDIDPAPPAGTETFAAGVRWLTLIVADVPRLYEELRAEGGRFRSEPVAAPDAAWIVCAVDPDGLLIELVQP